MSISIQYRGSMANTAEVETLMEEAEDIANIMRWPCEIWDEDWNRPPGVHFESIRGGGIQIVGHSALRGISLQPHPLCEPLLLLFRPDGSMSSPFQLALDAGEGYPQKQLWLSTETYSAGYLAHASIVRLLQHLKKRYLHNLEIRDATGFADSGDEARLQAFFHALSAVSG